MPLSPLVLLLLGLFIFLPAVAADAAPKDKTNIICFWVDGSKIKAVTLLRFDSGNGKVGVLSVPLYPNVEVDGQLSTIETLWNKGGKKPLINRLETLMRIKIHGELTFDQPVLEKASALIGTFHLKGRALTMAQAFEETRMELRRDDEAVLRAMAANIISPGDLHNIPRLLWLFTTQVESNISPDLMVGIYKVVCHRGPAIVTKRSLQGRDYYHGGSRYRYVDPDTWKNIMSEISA